MIRVMEYWDGVYTSREFTAKITYILPLDNVPVLNLMYSNTDFVVMSFKIISMSEVSANINEEALEDMIMNKSIMDLELSNN